MLAGHCVGEGSVSHNRDGKGQLSAEGRKNILWMVEGIDYPPSNWAGIDMKRFRELRLISGGSKRAAQFFRENLNRKVHRSVVESLLHDQLDYMKRLRENGGAKDVLSKEGITILSGAYDREEALLLNIALAKDEFVSVKL